MPAELVKNAVPANDERLAHKCEPILSWTRSDIEQRFGFRGARYTGVNSLLSIIGASVLTILFYLVIANFAGTYFADMFRERGWVPYCIAFFSAWACAILI